MSEPTKQYFDYVKPIGAFKTDSPEHKLLTDLQTRQNADLSELAKLIEKPADQ